MTKQRQTQLDPEEFAYPAGGFTRKGYAKLCPNEFNPSLSLPYGEIRAIRASIPDTYFSIPAHFRYRGRTIEGFLTMQDGEYMFTPERGAK